MATHWIYQLKRAILVAIVAAVLLITQVSALAQNGDVTNASPTKAPIVLDGRELFEVGSPAAFGATERATFANRVLQAQIRKTATDEPIPVRQVPRGRLITLRVAGDHLLTLTDQDLVGGISAEEQAELWVNQLQSALTQAQYERTDDYRQQVGSRMLFAALGVGSLSLLLRWLQRRWRRRRNQSSWRPFWTETGILLVQLGVWLGFVLWLTDLFPQTRIVRYRVLNFLQDTFTTGIISLGGQGYSVLDLGKILGLTLGLWLAVRSLTALIRSRVLQVVGIGREVQDTIALLIQITLIALGLLVLLQAVGVDISSLAILLSVIGVGIGFGLQNIANDFISGLIILLERPVQVGDFVKLDDLTGIVERIGIRSTEIRTLDRITIIVPNSELIDSKVVNWSHGYPVSRLHIPLGVAYGSPINQVRQAVLEAAKRHPQVLRYPKPQLWFEGFGDSALNFDLLVWIREPRLQARIKSDLYYLLEANLRRYQIEIPFPQRDLHLRSSDVSALVPQASPEPGGQVPAAPTVFTAASEDASDLDQVMDWCEILDLADQPTAAEIEELIGQMRGSNGVDIRDRRFGLKLYQRCFVGREAVQWFAQHQLASREEAIRLGQILVDRGIIHHVTDEHDFQDDYLFYRFFVDETSTTPESST